MLDLAELPGFDAWVRSSLKKLFERSCVEPRHVTLVVRPTTCVTQPSDCVSEDARLLIAVKHLSPAHAVVRAFVSISAGGTRRRTRAVPPSNSGDVTWDDGEVLAFDVNALAHSDVQLGKADVPLVVFQAKGWDGAHNPRLLGSHSVDLRRFLTQGAKDGDDWNVLDIALSDDVRDSSSSCTLQAAVKLVSTRTEQ